MIIGMCFLLGIFAGTSAEIEAYDMNVELDTEYGQLDLRWPETACDTYTVSVIGVNADKETVLYELPVDSTYYRATDAAAYACQENGFPALMRFRVDAVKDGQSVSAGITETFDPRAYFPEKEKLIIGEDIKPEDIRSLTWMTSGTTAESSQMLEVSLSGSEAFIAGHYYEDMHRHEVNKKLTAPEREEFMRILAEGSLLRSYVMDPEFFMLDGSSYTMTLSWNGMEKRDSYYVYRNDTDIPAWLIAHSRRSSVGWIAGCAGIGAVIGTLLYRKKKH